MSYHANDKDPANCPICNAELHSVNTKRIGNKAVCRDCAYKLMELWNAIGDELIRYFSPGPHQLPLNEASIQTLADDWGVVI